MLVLTRRLGETVVIGRNIEVKVISIHGQTVRLGVAAPPSVTVDRKELHESRVRRATPQLNLKEA